MNEIEPTQETIAWICKNAEQAWQEGDPKKLQFWEDQKKEFQRKCYQRIESLVKQKALLQQQQEALIQKVKNGEYTPEQANQINQQIYEHGEEIKKQLHFYRKLLQYPADEINTYPEEIEVNNSTHYAPTSEIPFQKVIPIEQFFYELFVSALRVIFLSNIGQIIICSIILIIAVYITWTWNTRNQQPQFEYFSVPKESKYIIHIYNRGLFTAKIYFSRQYRWEWAPYTYSLECYAETDISSQKTYLQVPLNCLFLENEITSPLTSSSLEISPGAQKGFILDAQCIKQNFPSFHRITVTLKRLLFRTEVLNFSIDLSQSPS